MSDQRFQASLMIEAKDREAAASHLHECERRLLRYDEAIRLLRLTQKSDGLSYDDEDEIETFLAEEPK